MEKRGGGNKKTAAKVSISLPLSSPNGFPLWTLFSLNLTSPSPFADFCF